MIRFSKHEDYAVILVNTLAGEYQKRLVPLSEVAREYNLSLFFLRNVARGLRKADLIYATEGKTGGYSLAKPPQDILLGDILHVFSKRELFTCCPPQMKGKHQRVCPKRNSCISGNMWQILNKEFIARVYNLSLLDVMMKKKGLSLMRA